MNFVNFDRVISLIRLFFLGLCSGFPFFFFFCGDFEDFLKGLFLGVFILTLVFIGLSFLDILVKGKFYGFL